MTHENEIEGLYLRHEFDTVRQFLVIHTTKSLMAGQNYTVDITSFVGPLASDLAGLYLSSYTRENNTMYVSLYSINLTSLYSINLTSLYSIHLTSFYSINLTSFYIPLFDYSKYFFNFVMIKEIDSIVQNSLTKVLQIILNKCFIK